ncbi:hypothetical protein PLICRDRAFT_30363 [Plicaturopsis crispa FD-325 SS-3]|nr:hypothetical protein PLICRDRAFT_30363 [Plicaturopsis crispa FD-325 SS-3]
MSEGLSDDEIRARLTKPCETLDIYSCPSLKEVLIVFLTTVKIHREAYEKHGMLHGDICPANLLALVNEEDGAITTGALVDLDYAKIQSASHEELLRVQDKMMGMLVDHMKRMRADGMLYEE